MTNQVINQRLDTQLDAVPNDSKSNGATSATVSSYLNYLPSIFQRDADSRGVNFIGMFLLAFEKVLSGLPEDVAIPDQRGLEQIIDHVYEYFDPTKTPSEFLIWLSSWVALTLRDDWSEEEKRRFTSRIVPLYRKRGTKEGLKEMLEIYTGTPVTISEYRTPLQIGRAATVGTDTIVGEPPPHFFRVHISLDKPDFVDFKRKEQIARAIIDQEKPAHTSYELSVDIVSMRVGVNSTVGKDTLLGTQTNA